MKDKQSNIQELAGFLERKRTSNSKIVLAGGCFDIFHIGHLDYLEAARKLGDVLIVGVNSDESIARIKARPPVFQAKARTAVLAALTVVDYVFVFGEDTLSEQLVRLRPHIFAKGSDYRDRWFPEMEAAREIGCEIRIAGEAKISSSSQLRQLLAPERRKQ
ncbi:HldE family cytidylyltransferase [Paenibacillus sp. FJAT-26967]|uniref:HldE family cytidylyltransferase n=1 Tax=Paenibacillus sp. FJAT-26967 TaxID=1729690 RepID=UPI0008396965|nr:HldE family cytidylyltransferase [Paenibacillus sp. FJAT-26967]